MAPRGFGLEVPSISGPPGEAKLVRPPVRIVFGKALLKLEKPDPPNPEVAAAAKGEGPDAAAKPVEAGFPGCDAEADLKTDVVELPREPKGDCSEPANAAKLDEAKAEADVLGAFLGDSSSLEVDGVEEAKDPNGETVEVFEKALLIGPYEKRSTWDVLTYTRFRPTFESESLSWESSRCRFTSRSPLSRRLSADTFSSMDLAAAFPCNSSLSS